MSRTFDVVRRWLHNGHEISPSLPHALSQPPTPPAIARIPAWQTVFESTGIPSTLVYPSTTLSRLLDQTTDRFGDAVAMVYNDRTWTYHQLLADVNRIAGGLSKMGVRRRDRVLLILPNCPEFVECFFAVQKLGAVVINAGPLMGPEDLEKTILMTSPRVVVALDLRAPALVQASKHTTEVEHWVWTSLESYQNGLDRIGYRVKRWYGGNGFENHAAHLTLQKMMAEAPSRPPTIEPDPDDIALLQPTGGTTGGLKFAQLSHRNLLANAMQVAACTESTQGQERVLALLPMFHIYGLTTCLLSGVFSAAQLILLTRFNAEQTLETIRKHHPTVFPLVPAICDALSDEIEKTPDAAGSIRSLRLCISGAAPLPAATKERFEKLTGAEVLEGYGLTEAGPVTHTNLSGINRSGTIGLPLPDTFARVIKLEGNGEDAPIGEPGELLISGPQVMRGYFGDPEQNRDILTQDAAGRTWLHTGDIATMDKDGYFRIVDRKKDMIIRSGLKIYPSRVEQVLKTFAGVKDVAVFGRPDAAHTERVIAAVVADCEPENRVALAKEMRAFCRGHLAAYEVPAEIEFMDSIPRSALGKVLKNTLRKKPAEPSPAEAPASEGEPQEKEAL